MKPKLETNDGRRLDDEDYAKLLNALQREKEALDAPLTNRAFLLGVAWLAEVISTAIEEVAYSTEDVTKHARWLHNVLLNDIECAEGDIEEHEELVNPHAAKEVKK
jgi:hypothetical protein